ncbi:MAG: penicillin-binding protein 2 [Draconibacterium sp.]|nr:MAG: penicillin-binding protein 2 [Draconibacterium sp.]
MDIFAKRKYLVIGVFLVVGLIFILKLFNIQVLDRQYKEYATNNVLREVVQYPARGLIYDRNGNLMVFNKPAYDLLITPREVEPFDTTYFCSLLDVSREDLLEGIQKAKDYSTYKPSILVKQIPPETYAILQEHLYKFKGFHTQSRTLREYSQPVAAHVLGYVSEVSPGDIARDGYYKSGDYIGRNGIEQIYETQLRGTKGIKKQLVDVHNRIQGSFRNGREDIPAEIGKNLYCTLDLDLQMYAEKLFQNKRGAVVAIEPSTGEVLVMLSAPTYDPGLLVGRIRSANYLKLTKDSLNPLFNRALQAKYPPGSTFKIINTLIGIQEGAINAYTRFSCAGRASSPISCTHDHVSPANVIQAIRESCNSFLWHTFRIIISKGENVEEGFNAWRNYVYSFGLGKKPGKDFNNALEGNLPTSGFYNNIYGKGHWNALTIRSLAIGQGELGVIPLQMANVAAIVANRGYYYTPHLVKSIDNDTVASDFKIKKLTKISPENFEPIIEGMDQVVNLKVPGKAKIPGVEMCGKTGTVENNQGSDHSVFIAFAPREDPKIAIFVYVENGVWGSRYAAPIASLIVEKYMNDTIATSRKWVETIMMDANLLNPIQPK